MVARKSLPQIKTEGNPLGAAGPLSALNNKEVPRRSASNLLSKETFIRKGSSGLKTYPGVVEGSGIFYKLTAGTDGPLNTGDNLKAGESLFFFSPGDDIIEAHQHTWLDADDNIKQLAKLAVSGLVSKIPGAGIGGGALAAFGLESLPIFFAAAGAQGNKPPSAFLMTINSVYTGSGTFATGFTTHLVAMEDPIKEVIEPATYIRDLMYGHVGSESLDLDAAGANFGDSATFKAFGPAVKKGAEFLQNANKSLGARIATLKAPPRWKLSVGNPRNKNWWAIYDNMTCVECNINWRGPYINGLPSKAQVSLRFVSARQIEGSFFKRAEIISNLNRKTGTFVDSLASNIQEDNPRSAIIDFAGGPKDDLIANQNFINSEDTAAALISNTSDTADIASGIVTSQSTIDLMPSGIEKTALQAQQDLMSGSSGNLTSLDNKTNSLFGDDNKLSFFGWSSVTEFQQSFDDFFDENEVFGDIVATGLNIAKPLADSGFPEASNLFEQWGGLQALGLSINDTSGPIKEGLTTLRGGNVIGAYLKGLVP